VRAVAAPVSHADAVHGCAYPGRLQLWNHSAGRIQLKHGRAPAIKQRYRDLPSRRTALDNIQRRLPQADILFGYPQLLPARRASSK